MDLAHYVEIVVAVFLLSGVDLSLEQTIETVVESFAQRYFNFYISSPYEVSRASVAPTAATTKGFIGKYNVTAISAKCGKNSFFAGFNPEHRNAVDILTNYYLDQPNTTAFFEFCSQSKVSPDIHPKIWYVAFLRAQLSRVPRILETNRASPLELFPTTFFPAPVFQNNTSTRVCVEVDERIGIDNGIENRLWYFREDIQLNAHHWVWHLLNPTRTNATIDRRGEFFYFFHHELLARYAAERIANNLPPQTPLNIQTDSILEEGFKPHLTDGISSRPFAERQPRRNLSLALMPEEREALRNLTIERNRVLDAINQGGILHANGFLEIGGYDSINVLGDISEASNKSINRMHYGESGYHNRGHNIISRIDAPPGIIGVMGDEATAMRDVMFYRWHKYVDIIFQSYKLKHLKPYAPFGGDHPLVFKGIKVDSVVVAPETVRGAPTNHLHTFWKIRNFQLDGGLDFNRSMNTNRTLSINVCAKHLDHQEFHYQLNIRNFLSKPTLATVRIFLAPRYKSTKQNQRYTMSEQRSLFFTMDMFPTVLKPGINALKRKSTESTLTADWPKSIRELSDEIRSGVNSSRTTCECGFPHHLLLPKGTEAGMVFDLFVMVTNGAEDHVDNNQTLTRQQNDDFQATLNETCRPSYIHCGLVGRKYPDTKPMGYPFDRRPYSKPTKLPFSSRRPGGNVYRVVENLEAFSADIPNMHVSQLTPLGGFPLHPNYRQCQNLQSNFLLLACSAVVCLNQGLCTYPYRFCVTGNGNCNIFIRDPLEFPSDANKCITGAQSNFSPKSTSTGTN